jgi:ketosteroid isomerase-like protein
MRIPPLMAYGGLLVVLTSCGPGAGNAAADDAAVVRSVDSATRAFQEAERSLDPERIIEFLAPEFYMYSDGVRQDYETTAAQIRANMPSFQYFEPEWTDLEVTVLGPDGAVVSLQFRDSIVDGSGNLIQMQGPTTLAWRRIGSAWRIVYADADHYPVTPRDEAN